MKSNISLQRMTAERCAQLSMVAIANRLPESWICFRSAETEVPLDDQMILQTRAEPDVPIPVLPGTHQVRHEAGQAGVAGQGQGLQKCHGIRQIQINFYTIK